MATLYSKNYWDQYRNEIDKLKRESVAEAQKPYTGMATPQQRETLTDIVRVGAAQKSTGPGSVFHEIAKPTREQIDLETKKMLAESVPQSVLDRLLKTAAGTAEYLALATLRPFYGVGEAIERAIGIEPAYDKPITYEKINRRLEELLPGGPTLQPAVDLALSLGGYRRIGAGQPASTTPMGVVVEPYKSQQPSPTYRAGEMGIGLGGVVTKPTLPAEAPSGAYYQYVTPSGTIGFTDRLEAIPEPLRGTAKMMRFEDVGRGIFGGPPSTYGTMLQVAEPKTYMEWFRDPRTGELLPLGERTYTPGARAGVVEPVADYWGEYSKIMERLAKPIRSFAYMPGEGRFPITGYTRTQLGALGDIARTIAGKVIEEEAMAPYRRALTEKAMADIGRTAVETGLLPSEKQAEIFEKYARGMQAMRGGMSPFVIPPGHTVVGPYGERWVAEMPYEKGSTTMKIYEDLRKAKEADPTKAWTRQEELAFIRDRVRMAKGKLKQTGEWEDIPSEFKYMTREEFFPRAIAKYKKQGIRPTQEQLEAMYQAYVAMEEGEYK